MKKDEKLYHSRLAARQSIDDVLRLLDEYDESAERVMLESVRDILNQAMAKSQRRDGPAVSPDLAEAIRDFQENE